MSKKKLKVVSDYILIAPDVPKGGAFSVADTYVNETGTLEAVGPKVSEEVQALVGKKVIFNAWACDQKTVGQDKFYFATESANAICAVI